jgi:glutamate carboxypeptidase
MLRRPRLLFAFAVIALPLASRAALTAEEEKIAAYIDAHRGDFVRDLEAAVKIDSATENFAGIRQMSDFFGAQLHELGFSSQFVPLPAETKRAGHLVAERKGTQGKRVLLIGHLDTVLPGGTFRLEGDKAYGSGAADIKGGNLVMVYALKALHAVGALEHTQLIVVMTGDEEAPGQPLSLSRKDLWDAAKRSDLALAFEGAIGHTATIARRGIVSWELEVQGATGHSSAIFAPHMGSGAVFELARILAEFHAELTKMDGITCNPALVVGGTEAELDRLGGKATGKGNIVAQRALANGDLRFLSVKQKEEAQAKMRAIVAKHLLRTSAELRFLGDSYPAMEATAENRSLLKQLDAVSRDLGYGEVAAHDPKSRGAGDASFVSPPLPALDGLGASGRGAHAPGEYMDLATMPEMVKRTAVLLYRLTR